MAGPADAVVIAKFRNSDELNEFLIDLNKKSDVIRTQTHVVLKTLKEDFRVII